VQKKSDVTGSVASVEKERLGETENKGAVPEIRAFCP